jgi:hypothetical protein
MTNIFYDCGYYYVGGAFAGLAGTMISQPFDTIKIHLQTKKPFNFQQRNLAQNILWGYRGVTPCIVGYSLEKAFIFGTYSSLCNYFTLDEKNIYHTFCAGLSAGLIASFSITIAEQLKTDQQLLNKSNYNIRHLLRGWKYCAIREGIGFSIYFNVYNQFPRYYNKDNYFWLWLLNSAAIGGFSAFIAWIPIYPIDANKTRIQAGLCLDEFKNEMKNVNIYNKIKILYRGYSYAMMRAVPFHSTCFVVFELLKHYHPNNNI